MVQSVSMLGCGLALVLAGSGVIDWGSGPLVAPARLVALLLALMMLLGAAIRLNGGPSTSPAAVSARRHAAGRAEADVLVAILARWARDRLRPDAGTHSSPDRHSSL